MEFKLTALTQTFTGYFDKDELAIYLDSDELSSFFSEEHYPSFDYSVYDEETGTEYQGVEENPDILIDWHALNDAFKACVKQRFGYDLDEWSQLQQDGYDIYYYQPAE